MKITDLLTTDTIILDLEATNKADVIEELTQKLEGAGKLNNLQGYQEAIKAREAESTTGIGEGVAIPHAKTAAVKQPAIAFGRSQQGVDYDSLDGQPAHLFFMIAAGEGANNTHLEALSKLSTFLLKEDFRQALLAADSKEDVIELIGLKENEDADDDEMETESKEHKGKILAVTACPTGIAHTYMAADSLKEKAGELGYDIKVQTNGSTGVKNKLTDEDIKDAMGIIVAADTKVDMDPFIGKPVVEAPVADGIRQPEALINQITTGEANVYQNGQSSYQEEIEEQKQEKKSKQPAFYKHLMNGVSFMLPFVVGGGILTALSFFFGIHSAEPDQYPEQFNWFADILKNDIAGQAMSMLVPILAGYIAFSIAERPGLAPGIVGGLMAASSGAGFLGGLIAGFLAGYVTIGLKRLFDHLPDMLDGLKPVLLFPVFGIFITGFLMHYINIPVEAIMNGVENWLNSLGTGNLVIMGILLGGMMSIDMGGPINKAAYAFGIAMITSGNYHPMAAIMAGGMVPPLGMAIATTFFGKKFNQSQRSAGKTAYFLGASFITEGALPFAAADPIRVIISSVIGSALAGGLSMLFNISLQAPHGGIFVIWSVGGSWFMYAISIIVGAIVTGIIYGIWKKSE
ncbi:PTS fructose transporter subunit IIABC [Tuberibacillus sp. Marseille-P3662]|uniref:PTS fructose transporter subunit IIABC n=1 Tax=Tuberibacillus sp. Marseille-P3662 TaxID=1965358 RepID=UPI000A1C88BE|nr:PTS fructose transporter subunit IIABC [Tuberibacillus sp. Marseille-P3662]